MDRFRAHRQLAGLDASDVEHLVDQVEEMPAGPHDVPDRLAVLGAFEPAFEQLTKSEDGVQRRPKLMAHA